MKSGKWTHIQRRRRPSYLRFRHTPPPRQVGIRRNQLDDRIGRWLSNDPIGISGGLNQYVFCANNPVNFVDPDGLADVWINGSEYSPTTAKEFFDALSKESGQGQIKTLLYQGHGDGYGGLEL